MAGALAGIRVLEFANYVSGPYAGMLLSDLGAEVIKVEAPGKGDPFRGWGRMDYSPTFGSVNRNKKSITLDLKAKDDLAAAVALAKESDVLIENFRNGAMDRLGLGFDALSALHPGLIYCSITGFGRGGPYASRPGYDTIGQAMSGLMSLLTDIDNPQPMGISLSDHLSGMVACNGILAALIARGRTGKGQRVETSLLEATMSFCGENAARYFDNKKVPSRATRAQQAQVYAFVASDGKPFVIHLSSPTKFWTALTEVASHPQWLSDPRYETKETRARNYPALREELAAVFKTAPRAKWLAELEAADIPCAPLNNFAEAFDDPQVAHLKMRQDVPHPKRGTIGLLRNGLRMSGTPLPASTCPPELGEHNDAVLGPLRIKT